MKYISSCLVFLLSYNLPAQGPAEIDQVYETFSKAYDLLDSELIKTLYEPDAFYFYPQTPVQRGYENFMGGFEDMFRRAKADEVKLKIEFRIIERNQISDHAYDVGYYRLSRSNGQVSVGKFVTILRLQQDGSWKFVLDTYSSAPLEAFEAD